MDSESVDLSFGFQMEEEVYTEANTIESSCEGALVIDRSKCLWCQTVTNEKASQLGIGLPTFIQNCQVMGRADLVAYVTMQSNTNLKVILILELYIKNVLVFVFICKIDS
jgi:hypothetical protein